MIIIIRRIVIKIIMVRKNNNTKGKLIRKFVLLFFIYRISLTNFVLTFVYTPIHLEIKFFVFFFNGKVMGQWS